MIDYDFLFREFSYIAKNMNLTAAAKELNTTQSALTKHLDSAEKELGVILIERKRGATKCGAITPAGQILLDAACSISHTYYSALIAIEQLKKTNAHVAVAASSIKYVFRETVRAVNERLGDQSSLALKLDDQLEAMPFDLLRDRKIDAAFEPFSRMADTRLLSSIPLFRESATLVVHESNPIAQHDSISIKATDGLQMVTRASQIDYSTRKHIHSLCEDHGIQPCFLIKAGESLSATAYEHLGANTAIFCPGSYKGYLKATVPFARFVDIEEEESAFDMRFFYRDASNPDIRTIVGVLESMDFPDAVSD